MQLGGNRMRIPAGQAYSPLHDVPTPLHDVPTSDSLRDEVKPAGGELNVDGPFQNGVPMWWRNNVHGCHHELFAKFSGVGEDSGATGLKNAVVGWSNGYYVAFALMMTVAFALLVIVPDPRDIVTSSELTVEQIIHWRPHSGSIDAVMQLLYVFFCLAAAYDSTWGMLLCAAWAVRAPCVPAKVFERFLWRIVSLKTPDNPNGHGLIIKTLLLNRRRFFGEVNAWDPFYFIDRNVFTLFSAGAIFLYLSQGLIQCLLALFFLLALRQRVRQTIVNTIDGAMFPEVGTMSDIYGTFGQKTE